MADPTQTPQRGNWVCPCSGCGKARKQAFEEVLSILYENNDTSYNAWRVQQKYNEEYKTRKK
jgi:hypothetical protein